MRCWPAALAALVLLLSVPNERARAAQPLSLVVDARDVARSVLHVQLDVPVPGDATKLVFPKWVPGEHAPANPVVDLVMLQAAVQGTVVTWERDPVDLFAFTFAAPAGATTLHLRYDVLLVPGSVTSRLALIDWNPTLLYPAGAAVAQTAVAASLLVPAGWSSATALDAPRRNGDRIDFAPVSIERLFDSPVLTGSNLTTVTLSAQAELDVASDSPFSPIVDPHVRADFIALAEQAQTVFGARHWRDPYRFLITATDAIGYTGLEHHESSWNGVDTDTLATAAATKSFAGDLLCHEFVHSWNGKYRRPAGLVRPDDQMDERTDLLWVYEGLTEYYSDVLAVRSGFWSPAEYRAVIAAKYAYLDAESGRATRSLSDTTFQARLRTGRATFPGARRSAEEYYDEGELMWLDADTLIRTRTRGRHSLDDVARAFFGGIGGPPAVVPYTRADIVAALNAVLPYGWDAFFSARLDVPTAHPPLDGITRGGYALAFGPHPETANPSTRIGAGAGDYRFSLGVRVTPAGTISDVLAGSPAAAAGLVPGMTLVAVNDRRYSVPGLTAAVEAAAKSKAPIAMLTDNRQTFATLTLTYTGGVKLPYLVRASGTPALIDDIARPRPRPHEIVKNGA